MDIAEIRRHNLRALMTEHSAIKLARMLGYRQSSFLSQMAGPQPTREITEKTACMYERELGMEPGTLDRPPVPSGSVANSLTPTASTHPLSSEEMIAMVLKTTSAVGRICESESVNLPTNKFAELLVMGLKDAIANDGNVQEDRIQQIMALLK